jgi:dienelactone hydrolase
MKKRLLVLAAVAFFSIAFAQEATQFTASDGLKIYARFYPAQGRAKATIMAFHQADSSKGEYAKIAPRLNELGFHVLAVDQRSGGSVPGDPNETVQANNFKESLFIDALPDLEAAFAWVHNDERTKTGKLIAWGSSYSSSLAFLLAQQHPEINAVMAFSPSDSYLEHGGLVLAAAKSLKASVFIASTSEEKYEAKSIFSVVPHKNKIFFVPKGAGFHGSNALNLPISSQEYWAATEQFLAWFK